METREFCPNPIFSEKVEHSLR